VATIYKVTIILTIVLSIKDSSERNKYSNSFSTI